MIAEDRTILERRVGKAILEALSRHGVDLEAPDDVLEDPGRSAIVASAPQIGWGDMVVIGARQ